ncbi:quinone oxidoreductase family protein [Shinella sp. YE25]|uniref:quinone oxidoreductase family protein n=1 Tax=unclassified Shinella TaxID=2643062 RepID=UPI003FA76491
METSRIIVRGHGGPEVLELESVRLPPPGENEVRVRHTAIGLNFIDIYFRTGLYSAPGGLPVTPGQEAAGVVEAVGSGVQGLEVGQRVAYCGSLGAYSQHRNVPASVLVPVPDSIGDDIAASVMLKGITAEYLLRRTYRVEKGETILFHAAAGGVGSIACQWAKRLGARVIGTVGSEDKVEFARQCGCDEVLLHTDPDLASKVKALSGGKGVPVVYDGIGNSTFLRSLDCLRPRGLMVSFGNASGAVEAFNLGLLAQKGSLYVTRPAIATYTSSREELIEAAKAVFEMIASGAVGLAPPRSFPLVSAGEAQAMLEGGKTTGTTILKP